MSETLVCPWCGELPVEYNKWEEDGFLSHRFGCNNLNCPVRPFIGTAMRNGDELRKLWNAQTEVLKLKEQVIESVESE